MAKKASNGGKKKTKAATRKPAAKKAKGRRRPAARSAGPRSQTLRDAETGDDVDGMDRVRDNVLDAICEAIGECRDDANRARQAEGKEKPKALKRMHEKGIEVYTHANVELVRQAGEEQLRVRTTKKDGVKRPKAESAPSSAQTSPAPAPAASAEAGV